MMCMCNIKPKLKACFDTYSLNASLCTAFILEILAAEYAEPYCKNTLAFKLLCFTVYAIYPLECEHTKLSEPSKTVC